MCFAQIAAGLAIGKDGLGLNGICPSLFQIALKLVRTGPVEEDRVAVSKPAAAVRNGASILAPVKSPVTNIRQVLS